MSSPRRAVTLARWVGWEYGRAIPLPPSHGIHTSGIVAGPFSSFAGEDGAKRRMGYGPLPRPKSDCTSVTANFHRARPALRTPSGLRATLCPEIVTESTNAMSETRKIAAILAADVVGYSRLAGADEERFLARLRTLRSDLVDPTIAVHNGRVVKRAGDGLIVEFRSVVDAVRCVIEIQSAMVERNAGVAADRRIEFRIGLHLGDVVEEADSDLMGDGVNIAARLQAGLLKLKPGLTLQQLGSFELSDDPEVRREQLRIGEGLRKAGLPEGKAGLPERGVKSN